MTGWTCDAFGITIHYEYMGADSSFEFAPTEYESVAYEVERQFLFDLRYIELTGDATLTRRGRG